MNKMEELAAALEEILPPHPNELFIMHNPHKMHFESLEGYLSAKERPEFATPTSRQDAIISGQVWCCQWWKNTPEGYGNVYASTLAELLSYLSGKSA